MISELVLATWVGLGAYIIWFFTSAKDYAALTSRETTILWKLHKKQTNCSSTKFETVRRKNRIVDSDVIAATNTCQSVPSRNATYEHKH